MFLVYEIYYTIKNYFIKTTQLRLTKKCAFQLISDNSEYVNISVET